MSIILGPIVGTAITEARLWIKGKRLTDYTVVLTKLQQGVRKIPLRTNSDGIGVAIIPNLKPNSDYFYSIVNAQKEVLFPGGRFATFPVEDSHDDFSFSFFSCHRPFEKDSMTMWERLSDICHHASRPDWSKSLRFMLAIGDQVYVDKPDEDYLEWFDMNKLKKYFFQKYEVFWSQSTIRNAFARCPVYMTWDDHEIRDGWGSRQTDRSGANPVYAKAQEAYIKHQLWHNPYVLNPMNKKYYSFRYGKAGFIILDLRGERLLAYRQMMSSKQWSWLEATLKSYCAECDVVFVACSVPFMHLKYSLKKLLGHIQKKALEDLWNSDEWRDEGLRFAELLFDVASMPASQGRIYLLGGDIHVATCGEIFSKNHPLVSPIQQFTCSGISVKPTKLNKLVKSSKTFDLFGDDIPYRGRLPYIIAKRNFGIVRLEKGVDDRYQVYFDVHYKDKDEPWTYKVNQAHKPFVVKGKKMDIVKPKK